jgi:hypothetical protein
LIVSRELDPTVDEVVLALGERGAPVFRIDRAWFPQRLTLEAGLCDGRWAGCLRTTERRVELDDVQSVWYRWRSKFVLSPLLSPPDRQHAEREARTGFDGVSEAARIDFRTDYRALRHEVIELPDGVAHGIRRFMAESGLLMASMDFSVGRDGRYYFLESNPAGGQYGWLEAKTGVRITEAVADLLAQAWTRSS